MHAKGVVDVGFADCASVVLESAGQAAQDKADEELGLKEHVYTSLFVVLKEKGAEEGEVG